MHWFNYTSILMTNLFKILFVYKRLALKCSNEKHSSQMQRKGTNIEIKVHAYPQLKNTNITFTAVEERHTFILL